MTELMTPCVENWQQNIKARFALKAANLIDFFPKSSITGKLFPSLIHQFFLQAKIAHQRTASLGLRQIRPPPHECPQQRKNYSINRI